MQTGKSQEVQIEGSHFTIVEVHTTQAKFYTAAVPHDVPLRVVGGGCGVAVVGGGCVGVLCAWCGNTVCIRHVENAGGRAVCQKDIEYCAHGVAISDMWRMPEGCQESRLSERHRVL